MSTEQKYQVEVCDHDGKTHRVDLGSDEMSIGRSATADIHLDWATISRNHAKIVPAGDGVWQISDLGSGGGILVNGKRTSNALIRPGDVVTISHFRLKLVEEQESE